MEFVNRAVQYLENSFHTSNFTGTVLVISLLLVLGYYMIRDHGVPPGPIGIPVLGYWLFLSEKNINLQHLALKKKYGDVYSFRVAGKLYIHLATMKVLREAHVTKSDCFQRISEYSLARELFEHGTTVSNGEQWNTSRKYFLNQYKERGMLVYKANTAEVVNETVTALIKDLRQNVEKPLDIVELLGDKVQRIVFHALFELNASAVENKIHRMLLRREKISSLFLPTNFFLTGNFAKYLVLPFVPNYKEACEIHSELQKMFLKIIEDRKKTFDSENIRDIVDDFINEREKRELKGDPTAKHLTDELLAGNLQQVMGDSLGIALYIFMLLKPLLDHPEEQEKIYKELVEVCGEDRNPSFEDKNNLTYTNAYMLEAQRTSLFLPLTPSLECIKETTVGGYRIPKGAITVISFCGIHQDPKEYQDPEKFNPLRFIDREGKPKEEPPLSFGIGKRSCIGGSFLLMLTFVYLTALVKNFKLSYYHSKSDYEVRSSKSVEVCISPRH